MDISFASATIEYASNCTGISMTSQVLSEQTIAVESFVVASARAHAGTTRDLNAQLTLEHGLTISATTRCCSGSRARPTDGCDASISPSRCSSRASGDHAPARRPRAARVVERARATRPSRRLRGADRRGARSCATRPRAMSRRSRTIFTCAFDDARARGADGLLDRVDAGRARRVDCCRLPDRSLVLARSSASSDSVSGHVGPGTSSRSPPSRTVARPVR